MQVKLLALVAALGALLIGCDDPIERVPLDNRESFPVVYQLNGSPVDFPSGLALFNPFAVPVDANFSFDLAFDLGPADSVKIYTVRYIASELASPRRVGVQPTELSFAEALTAPTTGYVYDSTLTIPVGRTLFLDIFDPSCAGSFFGSSIRAKIVVDSVKAASGAVYLHALTNPNCGLKSLVQGEPEE